MAPKRPLKTSELQKGINAIQNQSYRVTSSQAIWHLVGFGGHWQTFVSEFKEQFRDAFLSHHAYDRREMFTLSDGGQIYLDFMGTRFKKSEIDSQDKARDI